MKNMKTSDAKTRLIGAMTNALQRRGLHGSGLTELLAEAEAPKGVLYHHFPGGKTELAVAAIEATTVRLCAGIDASMAASDDPGAALLAWIGGAQKRLDASGYERGCPLATIALETTAADVAIRAALAASFAAVRERIGEGLIKAGYAPAAAHAAAALLLAAYEGGLLQARVAGSPAPMTQVSSALLTFLQLQRPQEPGRETS